MDDLILKKWRASGTTQYSWTKTTKHLFLENIRVWQERCTIQTRPPPFRFTKIMRWVKFRNRTMLWSQGSNIRTMLNLIIKKAIKETCIANLQTWILKISMFKRQLLVIVIMMMRLMTKMSKVDVKWLKTAINYLMQILVVSICDQPIVQWESAISQFPIIKCLR